MAGPSPFFADMLGNHCIRSKLRRSFFFFGLQPAWRGPQIPGKHQSRSFGSLQSTTDRTRNICYAQIPRPRPWKENPRRYIAGGPRLGLVEPVGWRQILCGLCWGVPDGPASEDAGGACDGGKQASDASTLTAWAEQRAALAAQGILKWPQFHPESVSGALWP